MDKIFQWILDKKFILLGIVFGFLGGWWGTIIGFITGLFIHVLIKRKQKDKKIFASLENPTDSYIEDEPFDGAILLVGLVIFCVGNEEAATSQIKAVFPEYSNIDWFTICRVAGKIDSLNADLLAECLAAKYSKNKEAELLKKIFILLAIVEFGWNYERGQKPSEYLASLLQYKYKSSEIQNAYGLLDISETASMQEIKKAYRKLVALYHPDSRGNLSEEQKKIADEMFIRVQLAYETVLENTKLHV